MPSNEKLSDIDVFELQKMNFHMSQLPFYPKCPSAPILGKSLTLPMPKN